MSIGGLVASKLGRGQRVDRPLGPEAADEALADHAIPHDRARAQALGRLAGAESLERRAEADGVGERSDWISRSPRSAIPLRRRISRWVVLRISCCLGRAWRALGEPQVRIRCPGIGPCRIRCPRRRSLIIRCSVEG